MMHDQQSFLANAKNKNNFIGMLMDYLQKQHFVVFQSCEDADTDVVAAALQIASKQQSVVVVADRLKAPDKGMCRRHLQEKH